MESFCVQSRAQLRMLQVFENIQELKVLRTIQDSDRKPFCMWDSGIELDVRCDH